MRYSEYSEYSEKAVKMKNSFKETVQAVIAENSNKERESQSNYPNLRLVAYFKPGSKRPKWMWDGSWLLTYYRTYYGLTGGSELAAIKMKIQEILGGTTRIVVFDNRSGKVPVLLEYVNGKLRVDNTHR